MKTTCTNALFSFFFASLTFGVIADDSEDKDRKQDREEVLEPIVINARGFAEDTIETPFVVKTISGDDVEDAHFVNVEDALRNQPSANVHNGGNVEYSSLWLRGTGSLSITSLDDNSVDFRVDGVSNGKTGLVRNLTDVEVIEVVKGPQGTLLGSKAEAGSISVKTVDPEDVLTGRLGVGIGNYNMKSIHAMLNVPINDNFALRVAGMNESVDNQLQRKESGKPLNEQQKRGIHVKLGWHDDALRNRVILGAYHDRNTNNVPALQRTFSTRKIATFGLPYNSENTAEGVTLRIESDLDFADFTSQTGYHRYEGEIARPALPPEMLGIQYAALQIPVELQPALNTVFSLNKNNRQRWYDDYAQYSQEFRLASKPEDDLKWVVGLFFDKKMRDLRADGKIDLSELPDGPAKAYLTTTSSNGDTYKTSDSGTQAVFGEITYPATDKLDIIAGARLTHERLNHKVRWIGNSNNALATKVKAGKKTLSETTLTGRLGLSYEVTPNFRIYGLQSRGHKFGGFADYESNVVYDQPLAPHKSTTIDASEIGAKYRSKDGSFRLGVALFQNTMKDDHISLGGLPPEYKTEAANVDSQSRGLEVDADWQVNDRFRLYGDVAFTKTEVTHVPKVVFDRKFTKKGNHMPQVPETSASFGVQYRDEVSFIPQGIVFADLSYRYVGARYAEANNQIKLKSYGLLNAQIGLGNDHHRFTLWGKNLTNEHYKYLAVYPYDVGGLGPERTFGIKYTYEF